MGIKLINIGFGNIVSANRLVALVLLPYVASINIPLSLAS